MLVTLLKSDLQKLTLKHSNCNIPFLDTSGNSAQFFVCYDGCWFRKSCVEFEAGRQGTTNKIGVVSCTSYLCNPHAIVAAAKVQTGEGKI